MDRAFGRFARLNIELPEQLAEADARALVADADPDGAILVMDAHGDHRPLEPWVGHSRHCQQQFAGQERGLLRHSRDHATPGRGGQYLRPSYGGPKSRFIVQAKELST
jgi:hypothetical protein